MQLSAAAAGTLLLLVTISCLSSSVQGRNITGWAAAAHTRHLQSSCDTGSFPELKPVSFHQCQAVSCILAVYISIAVYSSTHCHQAVNLYLPDSAFTCRQFWTREQQGWSGQEPMIRCAVP